MSHAAKLMRRNTPLGASNEVGEGEQAALLVEQAGPGCQRGERAAQRQIYELCRQNVFRLAARIVGVQDAADVVQQAFLQAFRRIEQFAGRSRFETWLFRLTVNEALQHLRRNKRWPAGDLPYEPMDESPGYDRQAEQKELLEQALARIDPELRAIFLLREVEELSYREIAAALNIPEGTVGSRLNRARHELQQQLKDLGWEP
jgi:RNA polymerase sigma-70 factor (ECF subfamily)